MHSLPLILVLIVGTFGSCNQAWCGGGTDLFSLFDESALTSLWILAGPWFRADTLCDISNFAFMSTEICFPTNVIAGTVSNEGFYLSLGSYNTLSGHGIDVGLTLAKHPTGIVLPLDCPAPIDLRFLLFSSILSVSVLFLEFAVHSQLPLFCPFPSAFDS